MADYKVAYGAKTNIPNAIAQGIIPPGSIILTSDSDELFFYDLSKQLKTYQEKYKFASKEEAETWIGKYDCSGQILSVHEDDKCNLYVVGYDGELHSVTSSHYVSSDKNPTENDYDYEMFTHWLNENTNDIFIFAGVKEGKAVWKNLSTPENVKVQVEWVDILNKPDFSNTYANYTHKQTTASAIWEVHHNLNRYPTVTITDSANSVVLGDVEYIDPNSLKIKFSAAFSGIAFMN